MIFRLILILAIALTQETVGSWKSFSSFHTLKTCEIISENQLACLTDGGILQFDFSDNTTENVSTNQGITKADYNNFGIEQTWEFAHPSNKKYTGPLSNFINMMYSKSYSIMINHKDYNINLIAKDVNLSFFLVELVDKTDNKFQFQWIVEKVLLEGAKLLTTFLGSTETKK